MNIMYKRLCIPLHLDIPEVGDLMAETRRRVHAYVRFLISVMCKCWYNWMITEAAHVLNKINIHTPLCGSNFLNLDFKYS